MKFFTHKKINNKGFTLLETLIGISILIIAITATFTAAQSGLSSSIESRDQVTAFALAQEGIELIRNTRDTNTLTGSSWLAAPLSSCTAANSYCTLDSVTNTISACPTPTSISSCPYLRQDTVVSNSTYGMYGSNAAWTPTLFRRVIQITTISANEAVVTVIVDWSKGSFSKTLKVQELILNWI